MQETKFEDALITALGHDGFLVEFPEEQLTIVFDPFEIQVDRKADYVFISHPHFDHCHPESIRALMADETKIIAPTSCQKELADFGNKVEWYEGTNKVQLEKFTYWAIPAYNINKFRTPTEVFHPKELGGVGFLVEVKSTRLYHAGDTDLTPEMETLKKIDVAFLPISGTYVMTVEEAVKAAELIAPKLAIPMHFGKVLGSVTDAHRFQSLLKDRVPVAVLTTDHP
jgi:L-ascorbate metabolism protein UlaG (beta-lactamase superfamily)